MDEPPLFHSRNSLTQEIAMVCVVESSDWFFPHQHYKVTFISYILLSYQFISTFQLLHRFRNLKCSSEKLRIYGNNVYPSISNISFTYIRYTKERDRLFIIYSYKVYWCISWWKRWDSWECWKWW